ncbi:hypothetical protein [Persephonella sp.]
MNDRNKRGFKGRQLIIIIFVTVTLFSLDNLIPVKRVSLSPVSDRSVENPYFKYRTVYGLKTYRAGNSLITEEDILNALKESNIHYAFLTDQRENIFEGNYESYYILNKKLEECKEILDPEKLKISPLNLITYLKFFIWYPFNKDLAYNNIWKLYSEDTFFENFDPEKDKCFVGTVQGNIQFKTRNISFPELTHQIMLVKNYIFLEEKLIDQLYSTKLNLYLSMDSGRVITTLYYDPDLEIFVKTDDGFFTVGDLIDLSTDPEIFIRTSSGKFITAVYKNGKVVGYFPPGTVHIKPENPGYYNVVVFKYSFKLPFNLFLGVRPVAFSNGIFFK